MGKQSFTLVISGLLIFLSFLYISFNLVENKILYTTQFDPKLYEKKFNQSQWTIPNSKHPISDEDLYAYAGYKYSKGTNPILINPEVPPLGKYIIGASIWLFNNQRISSIFASILSLLLIFYIVYSSTHSLFTSSLSLFLTSLNSLFIDQFTHAPQLDVFQLLFLLFSFVLFLSYSKSKSLVLLILSGILIGCFLSIKFFPKIPLCDFVFCDSPSSSIVIMQP